MASETVKRSILRNLHSPYGRVVLTKIGSSLITCLLSNVQFQISFLKSFRHSSKARWPPAFTMLDKIG